jgi:hypothetical protein
MRWPGIEKLRQVKLTLEVLLLLILIPVLLYTLGKDRNAATKIGLAAR